MASEKSIAEAVRKAIEAYPLPATAAELDAAGLRLFEREAARRGMTVQTISVTTVYGAVGYRMDCTACGAKSGHDTEAQAVAAAKAHGKRNHS